MYSLFLINLQRHHQREQLRKSQTLYTVDCKLSAHHASGVASTKYRISNKPIPTIKAVEISVPCIVPGARHRAMSSRPLRLPYLKQNSADAEKEENSRSSEHAVEM